MKHPAKFSDSLLDALRKLTQIAVASRASLYEPVSVLDPFAGTGRIHELAAPYVITQGVEI